MDWVIEKIDQCKDYLTSSDQSERLLNSIALSDDGHDTSTSAREYIKLERPENRVKRLFLKKYVGGSKLAFRTPFFTPTSDY